MNCSNILIYMGDRPQNHSLRFWHSLKSETIQVDGWDIDGEACNTHILRMLECSARLKTE